VRKLSPKVTYNDIKKWQDGLPFFENGRKICYKMVELKKMAGSSFLIFFLLPILLQKNSLCYKVRKLSPKVTYNDIKKWQDGLPFFENGRKICYKMVELKKMAGSSFFSALKSALK
jgi:hypothetical protein